MLLNNLSNNLSYREKEELLLELCKTKKHLDNIEKTLNSFIEKNYFFNLNETLNSISKTKDSILNNLKSCNGSNLYIVKNNLTGEIYDIKESPVFNEDISQLKQIYPNSEIVIYYLKEYYEFYNEKDGIYYYNNDGIKKSLYTNYEALLHEEE